MTWFTKQEILNAHFIITMNRNICPYDYIAAKMSVNISHENQYIWCWYFSNELNKSSKNFSEGKKVLMTMENTLAGVYLNVD